METVYHIIILLIAIVTSDIIHKLIRKIPLIFIQIVMGILISFLPYLHEFELNPEIFMLVLIKPLIFIESQKLTVEELKKYVKPILSLSLSLAVVSIVFVGALFTAIVPQMPLSTVFLMAAILVPIHSGIVIELGGHRKLPNAFLHILEGESLFSESIAMILFEVALTANLTREFFLNQAVSKFIVSIVGGVVIGAILGFLIIKLRFLLLKFNLESPSMMVVIQLSTPFIIYYIAEHDLHVSGIIAIIIAGILHGIERPLLNLKSTKLQVISNSTWEVIEYSLDGFVAVLLGLVLPSAIRNMLIYDVSLIWHLIFIAVLLYGIVTGIRFVWVYVQPEKFHIRNESNRNRKRYSLVYAVSGVHGTISLAIALSLPLTIVNGEAFFFRQELIFVAALVILISIVVPAVIFPRVLEKEEETKESVSFQEVRMDMIYDAIHYMEVNQSEQERTDQEKLKQECFGIEQAVDVLKGQLKFIENHKSFRPDQREVTHLIHMTVRREAVLVDQLMKEGKVSETVGTFYKLVAKKSHDFGLQSILSALRISYMQRRLHHLDCKNHEKKRKFIQEYCEIQEFVSHKVIAYLNQMSTKENEKEVGMLIRYYRNKLENKGVQLDKNASQEIVKRQLAKAFEREKVFVEDALENGMISGRMAQELRKQISYDELIYLS